MPPTGRPTRPAARLPAPTRAGKRAPGAGVAGRRREPRPAAFRRRSGCAGDASDVTALLVHLVARYGLAVVFLGVGVESLGIPVPGETVLVIASAAATRGHLSLWAVAAAAWVAAVAGDNIGYWIGRRYGRRLVRLPVAGRLYSAERMSRAERLFERWGWIAVFLGRFVALLRILAGPLAGMHRMPWRTFLLANAAGAAVWVGAMTAVGMLVGANLDRALRLVSRGGLVGLGTVVLAAAGYLLLRAWRRRRSRSQPAAAECAPAYAPGRYGPD